jgi:putative effector of murein hydrolase
VYTTVIGAHLAIAPWALTDVLARVVIGGLPAVMATLTIMTGIIGAVGGPRASARRRRVASPWA